MCSEMVICILEQSGQEHSTVWLRLLRLQIKSKIMLKIYIERHCKINCIKIQVTHGYWLFDVLSTSWKPEATF